MIIALAAPRVAATVRECLEKIEHFIADAAGKGAEIVCFPEAYLPGLRGLDFEVPPFDAKHQELALVRVAECARKNRIAVVVGMERNANMGRQIVSVVINASGQNEGVQTKNQLDPTEDAYYVPGSGRRIFEINGIKFGIAICHEGFRYPETVRWAAVRGAKIVFHPHCTGSDKAGPSLTKFAAADAPYYEQAMLMRSRENTIYFASMNYAFRYQESATCVITPTGECQAYLPHGQEGVLVQTIDVEKATGLFAKRFAQERYEDVGATQVALG